MDVYFVFRYSLIVCSLSDWQAEIFSAFDKASADDTGPVVQWIVRKSPELDIQVRFLSGLQKKS